jgi:MoaD family protein
MAERISVRIPTPLRGHTDGAASVELRGATVGEVLHALAERHGKLRGRLFDEQGALNRFVNVFLNDEDVRFLQGLDTAVKDGDGVKLVPAIAGGSEGATRAEPAGIDPTEALQ